MKIQKVDRLINRKVRGRIFHPVRRCIEMAVLALVFVACGPDTIHIDIHFSYISGLAKGDRVLFQNNPAGKVVSVDYQTEGGYRVGLAVEEGYADALTEHSRFRVAADPGREGSKAVIVELARSGGQRLEDGASVEGEVAAGDIFLHWKREMESGLRFLQQQIEKFSRDVQGIPEGEAYQRLKRSLRQWAEEMEQASENTRDKIEREWLPRIERELDALRKQLKPEGREDKMAPLEREVERIRNI